MTAKEQIEKHMDQINESMKVDPRDVQALPKIPTVRLSPRERMIGRLSKIRMNRPPETVAAADLAADALFSLFMDDPQALPEIPEERQVNKMLLEWMQSTHGWEKTRADAVGNLPTALSATPFLVDYLNSDEALQEAMAKQEEAAEKLQKARQKRVAAEAMAQAASAGQDPDIEAMAQALATEADQAEAEGRALAETATEIAGKAIDNPLKEAGLMHAAAESAQAADRAAKSAAGWGMGPGSLIHDDPQAAMAFLEQNQGDIARIGELAGRMRGFAMEGKREKAVGSAPGPVDLTQDLLRVFPSELALLHPQAPDALRLQQMAQFAGGGLLGFGDSGDAEEQGAFVCAVDVSPSMHGLRAITAKAVGFGVAQEARRDGRPWILLAFASDRKTVQIVRHSDGWEKLMRWAASVQRGGTDFDLAMDISIGLLDDPALRRGRPDLLFVSDGEAGVSQATVSRWQTFQQSSDARLFYVPVGRFGRPDIERLADRVVPIGELDEQSGAELARQLGRWL